MAKNILRRQFSNMYGKNKPYQNPEPIPVIEKLPEIEPPNVTVGMIIIYTILLILFTIVYLNRDYIYSYFEKMYNDFKPTNQIDEIEEKYHKLFQQVNDTSTNNSSKNEKIGEEIEKGNHRMDEIIERGNKRMDSLEEREKRLIELLEKNQTQPPAQTCNSLEKKEKDTKETEKKEEKGAIKQLDEKIGGYSKEQTVNANGFCYIGFDNYQRECTTVSAGDICMSGQVFPSLDVCLYPKFRSG